jgi:cell division protease FtsH
VRRIVEAAIGQVRQILEARRAALEAVARRLIECEVIDGNELRNIVEASIGSPQIVPGTVADRRPPRPPADTDIGPAVADVAAE